MPLLNPKKHKITTQKQKDNDFQPINLKVDNLTKSILKLFNKISKLEKQHVADDLFREKINNFISYTDKKRLNTVHKEVNMLKKQVNLSKTSKILKCINDLKDRIDHLEDNLGTPNESDLSE